MELSIILARFFGLAFTVFGIGVIANPNWLRAAIDKIIGNEADQLMAAVLPLFIGSYIVAAHNIWVANWTVLVTVVGWLMFAGGAFRTLCPGKWMQMTAACKDKIPFGLVGAFQTIFGAVFLYFGFFS